MHLTIFVNLNYGLTELAYTYCNTVLRLSNLPQASVLA